MVNLASKLGIEIVAKNVETEEQQAFLLSTAQGTNAQGFFYGKPLAAEQTTDFLRDRHSESGMISGDSQILSKW